MKKNNLMCLKNKNIVIGITGSIAAYKIPAYIRETIKQGANVKTVLTRNAAHFVGKASLATITQNPVYENLFSNTEKIEPGHISLSDWGDVLVLAPATANMIGKFASGIADDYLSTLLLSFYKSIIVFPAMNHNMYDNSIVKENMKKLSERGIAVVEPETGFLACGEEGKGRLVSGERFIFELKKLFTKQDYKGKKIIITCGGTSQNIDPVRIITNKSSGKMGMAIAEQAALRGAEPLLIYGNIKERIPNYIKSIKTETPELMKKAIEDNFYDASALIMAAAVSDFKPNDILKHKIKRHNGEFTLKLIPSIDILKSISKKKGSRIIAAFALETDDYIKNGMKKLSEKGCDIIFVNSHVALDSEESKLISINRNGIVKELGVMEKKISSAFILDMIAEL